ncbi:caspase domain-containing protein [Ephemerocybe angulata]|uniref:Caspase domain-containing protein n=1 Tax=Ephemerocybe angulata TaxID=980116 RepID=A0A8H6I832_9AGAR|nr:caspase domain-containing protein [Tulosesus angulatus]
MFSASPSPIFALVIGIDSYKSGGIWNLHSCVDDAERIRRWLLHDLDVPKEQICLLTDSHATKENIENAFMDHLVNNPSIQPDDAILIFFAGHGSRINAPRDWYHGVRKPRTVEVLCTYDFDSRDDHGRVAGISDRSMHAMLKQLAEVKGDNISLVLDCCFSPSQTPENIRERSRTRWTPPIKTVPEDLYRGLWPGARAIPQHSQFGFIEPSPTTHVVIAACSPGHIAVEGKEGGRFTANFLDAVSNSTLHQTSYAQLIESMNRHAVDGSQIAVCLGKNKSRVLFNDLPFVVDPQFVSIGSGRGDLRIEAGSIHGVVEGSEFSIHSHNYRCSKNPSFAVAVVLQTHSTWSLARIKSQDSYVPRTCWGRIMRWNNPNPFTVIVKSSVATLAKGWKLKKDFPIGSSRTMKATGITVRRVKTEDPADISLTIHRRNIAVERFDTIVGKLGERVVWLPELNPIKVINDAARFNLHLSHNNPSKPLEKATRVEVFNIDADTLTKVGGNLLRDGRAVIHSNYNAIFTVTLGNSSNLDLWPYLVSMDPSNYSAHIIYPNADAEEDEHCSPLPAGGTMEIAANWYEPSGANQPVNAGFLKIYLSSTSVSLNNLFKQGAVPPVTLEPPARSSIFMDADSVASSCHTRQTLRHIWDTVTLHISFVRQI